MSYESNLTTQWKAIVRRVKRIVVADDFWTTWNSHFLRVSSHALAAHALLVNQFERASIAVVGQAFSAALAFCSILKLQNKPNQIARN